MEVNAAVASEETNLARAKKSFFFLESLQLVHPITCDQYDVCTMVLFFSAKAKPISFFTNFRGQCFGPEAVTFLRDR